MMNIAQMGSLARAASYSLAEMDSAQKNKILLLTADSLEKNCARILAANKEDVGAALENGVSPALVDRLSLDEKRVSDMANGIREVAALEDPCGKILSSAVRPNGLEIKKIAVPFGVIGIIYESRPNVTSDAAALCIKAGSAVILRGGTDALGSNREIVSAMRAALKDAGYDENMIQLTLDTSREFAQGMMRAKGIIDVLIPRGGAGLIKSVVENSTVPVIETGTGNCHAYVEKTADIDMAVSIIVNGKTSRPGVCNALESVVADREILPRLLPPLAKELTDRGVTIFADKEAMAYIPGAQEETEEDFAREYLDLKISVKTVSGADEAIEHINRNSTGHSEVIITRDDAAARRFTTLVDSACVYVNASTRFTDGGEFGLGAEIGISTQKLHARGPMGLNEIVSYKYVVSGDGQVR